MNAWYIGVTKRVHAKVNVFDDGIETPPGGLQRTVEAECKSTRIIRLVGVNADAPAVVQPEQRQGPAMRKLQRSCHLILVYE